LRCIRLAPYQEAVFSDGAMENFHPRYYAIPVWPLQPPDG
jgi:hypothetical protein